MLNKVSSFLTDTAQVQAGEQIVCAVSGGADSVALLFALFLLKDKLQFSLAAAHFNHHLRGEESNRDETFVRRLCDRYEIPLTVGEGNVKPGAKGLEAAAREARYDFLRTIPGRIATAHTADDNAETLLMHLLRGTGLKGLGGISPVNGNVIRPMLFVTRKEVVAFLDAYYLRHIEDSSNETDQFLRNRIRHDIMPLFTRENPSFAAGVSRLAMRLRQDEAYIQSQMRSDMPGISELINLPGALRIRYLERFLRECGVKEPEQVHLAVAEKLLYAQSPSAAVNLPGGIVIARNYDRLERRYAASEPGTVQLNCPGLTELPEWRLRIWCAEAESVHLTKDEFTVCPVGRLFVRSRKAGDVIRLSGGTKTLKKLFIDKKIPAAERPFIPVLADDDGVVAVAGIGCNLERICKDLPAVTIRVERI